MPLRPLPLPIVALLALLQASASVSAQAVLADPAPSRERQNELVHLVRQDCGSCHGMTLQGGLGPPLTPAALQDKPVDSLLWPPFTAAGPGPPMPPWHRFMSEVEARWIVDQLLAGFPESR
jgi:cytochrome c55X